MPYNRSMKVPVKEVIIPKEDAVFWLDGNGRWCNSDGPFRHKKIIAYFHSAIQKDALGFFVGQTNGHVREKVYFRYEDTALFVVDVITGPTIELVLNTSRRISLEPEQLFSKGDHLYVELDSDPVKFTDRALMKFAPYMEEEKGELLFIWGSDQYTIRCLAS
jgi:hypothetical protein